MAADGGADAESGGLGGSGGDSSDYLHISLSLSSLCIFVWYLSSTGNGYRQIETVKVQKTIVQF